MRMTEMQKLAHHDCYTEPGAPVAEPLDVLFDLKRFFTETADVLIPVGDVSFTQGNREFPTLQVMTRRGQIFRVSVEFDGHTPEFY
jgi:hypothetical protein